MLSAAQCGFNAGGGLKRSTDVTPVILLPFLLVDVCVVAVVAAVAILGGGTRDCVLVSVDAAFIVCAVRIVALPKSYSCRCYSCCFVHGSSDVFPSRRDSVKRWKLALTGGPHASPPTHIHVSCGVSSQGRSTHVRVQTDNDLTAWCIAYSCTNSTCKVTGVRPLPPPACR